MRLAADGPAIVAYAHANNEPIEDVVADLVDWTESFIPRLVDEGYLTFELAGVVRRLIAQSAIAINAGDPTRSCEEAVMDPEWVPVRQLAREALDGFRELGVSVPDLRPDLLRRDVPDAEL